MKHYFILVCGILSACFTFTACNDDSDSVVNEPTIDELVVGDWKLVEYSLMYSVSQISDVSCEPGHNSTTSAIEYELINSTQIWSFDDMKAFSVEGTLEGLITTTINGVVEEEQESEFPQLIRTGTYDFNRFDGDKLILFPDIPITTLYPITLLDQSNMIWEEDNFNESVSESDTNSIHVIYRYVFERQ